MSNREIIEFLNLHAQRINNLVAKRDLPDDTAGHWYLVGQFESVIKRVVADLELLELEPRLYELGIRGRQWLFGFDSELKILPGAECTLSQMPQIPLRIQRLCVPPSIGSSFLIQDVQIGNWTEVPIFQATIPAELFASDIQPHDIERAAKTKGHGIDLESEEETALAAVTQYENDGYRFDAHPCCPGMKMAIRVCNIGNSPIRFLAGVVGIGK